MGRKPTPSRTTNRLHFEDLDPGRFEQLCLTILYPLRPWADLKHFGLSGGDDGVDILARETLDDGSVRTWGVQCRRYQKAAKSDLCRAVDDVTHRAGQAPDVLLVVLACDVSRTAHECFEAYARERGAKEPMLWTASIIEARLYAARQDLLFAYFGIALAATARSKEESIRRNVTLKKRLLLDFRAHSVDHREVAKDPRKKFRIGRLIIRSIDDTDYPSVGREKSGIGGWFRVQLWDFYHNGLCVILSGMHVVVQGKAWRAAKHDEDDARFGYMLGRIPFGSIVEVDAAGDEYYSEPHIFCRFEHMGEPYESIGFVVTDGEYPFLLQDQARVASEPTMQQPE